MEDEVCAKFEDDVVVLSRGELMEAQRRQDLEQHLEQCAGCRQRYDEQKWLSESVAQLRRSSTDLPPADLGPELRTQFEAAQSRRTSWSTTIRIAAVAAVLCVAAYLTDRVRQHPVTGTLQQAANKQVESDDFVPIPYAPPLGDHEHVDVYRVRLPRHALTSFGVTTIPSHAGAVLTADIVVGEDGVARGIRIFP